MPDARPAGAKNRPTARREQARRQQAGRQRRQALLYSSALLVLVLVVGGLIWYNNQGQASCADIQDPLQKLYATLPASQLAGRVKLVVSPYSKTLAPAGPEVDVPNEGATHVTDAVIAYKHIPPASGPHYDTPADYSFNTKEVREGNWVHSLEHGAVVVLYQCDTRRVTAVAWDHQLPMEGVDAEKIKAFYVKYVDKGPEKVP